MSQSPSSVWEWIFCWNLIVGIPGMYAFFFIHELIAQVLPDSSRYRAVHADCMLWLVSMWLPATCLFPPRKLCQRTIYVASTVRWHSFLRRYALTQSFAHIPVCYCPGYCFNETQKCVAVCCSVLQFVAVCCRFVALYCNVFKCVAVCVVVCVAMCCSVLSCRLSFSWHTDCGCWFQDLPLQCVAVCCIVLRRVVVCCSVLQRAAVCWSVLQCVAACCSVLQRVAVCCSVLQCVAACCRALLWWQAAHLTNTSWVTWLIHTWHDLFIYDMINSYVTWLIHMWHDSSIRDRTDLYVTWPIYLWYDSFMRDITLSYVTWLIHMWHDSVTWHDSFIRNMTHSYVIWLIDTWHDLVICDMNHSYVTWIILHMWHDSFICDVTHSYMTRCIHMWHDSIILEMTYPPLPGWVRHLTPQYETWGEGVNIHPSEEDTLGVFRLGRVKSLETLGTIVG